MPANLGFIQVVPGSTTPCCRYGKVVQDDRVVCKFLNTFCTGFPCKHVTEADANPGYLEIKNKMDKEDEMRMNARRWEALLYAVSDACGGTEINTLSDMLVMAIENGKSKKLICQIADDLSDLIRRTK